MEETTTGGATKGRMMKVLAFGDIATELELDAIDQARAFFGDDVQLTVIRDYEVIDIKQFHSAEMRAKGKKFYAYVPVRAGE